MTISAPTDQIRQIEQLAARAWPAATVELFDGWWLRYTAGVTRRANSVLPVDHTGAQSLTAKLDQADDFYRRFSAPTRYQICPAAQPAELDAVLEQRGYAASAHTDVQIASVATVLKGTRSSASEAIVVNDRLTRTWFAAFCRIESEDEAAAQVRWNILQRIRSRTLYAHLLIEDQIAAVGVGVLENGWLGMFSVATHPAHRRRGAATAVIEKLAQWGHAHGARNIYLQVMQNNVAAQSLYDRLGFRPLYAYHYREAAVQVQ